MWVEYESFCYQSTGNTLKNCFRSRQQELRPLHSDLSFELQHVCI